MSISHKPDPSLILLHLPPCPDLPTLAHRHKKFLKDFPDGRLNRKEFADFHKRFFPSGDPSEFAEYFFDAFDSDRNGEINFREFICAFSLTSRGNPDVKLKCAYPSFSSHTSEESHPAMASVAVTLVSPPN